MNQDRTMHDDDRHPVVTASTGDGHLWLHCPPCNWWKDCGPTCTLDHACDVIDAHIANPTMPGDDVIPRSQRLIPDQSSNLLP